MTVATLDANLPSLAFETGASLFTELAERLSLPHSRSDRHLSLRMTSGEIALNHRKDGLTISLRADSDQRIYTLQQVVHSRLDQLVPAPNLIWDRVDEGALPPTLTIVTVLSVTQISPNFTRVRVAGPDLARFASGGLHFRLLVPRDAKAPKWPRIARDGRTFWPEGDDALHRPVYTTRDIDPAGTWLDFDVFLHDGGRITEWLRTAKAGHTIGIMGPSGGDMPKAAWLALFADETALPALARILANLPAHTAGHAFIMVADILDRQSLVCPPMVTQRWLPRSGAATLLNNLELLEIPPADRFIWFSSEKSEADAARAYIRADKGIGRSESNISAYWSKAEA